MKTLDEILTKFVGAITAGCTCENGKVYEKENYKWARNQIQEALLELLPLKADSDFRLKDVITAWDSCVETTEYRIKRFCKGE